MLSWLWNFFFKDFKRESLKKDLSSLRILLNKTKKKLDDIETAFKELNERYDNIENNDLELKKLLNKQKLKIEMLKNKLPKGVV